MSLPFLLLNDCHSVRHPLLLIELLGFRLSDRFVSSVLGSVELLKLKPVVLDRGRKTLLKVAVAPNDDNAICFPPTPMYDEAEGKVGPSLELCCFLSKSRVLSIGGDTSPAADAEDERRRLVTSRKKFILYVLLSSC